MQLANRLDGLEDSRDDLVWIGLRVWSTIFEVSLVAVVDKAVEGYGSRRTAVSHTVAELVDTIVSRGDSQSEVVVWTVSSDYARRGTCRMQP